MFGFWFLGLDVLGVQIWIEFVFRSWTARIGLVFMLCLDVWMFWGLGLGLGLGLVLEFVFDFGAGLWSLRF